MSANQSNIDSLKAILGKTFTLYVQTHGYHWNVEGPAFHQLHKLFEEHYTNLWGALDGIAERIRILGEYAPSTIAELANLGGGEASPAHSSQAMIAALFEAHTAIVADLRDAIVAAQNAADEVSAGLLTDRLQWHEKTLWMIRASDKASADPGQV